jgi:hypothetical protein
MARLHADIQLVRAGEIFRRGARRVVAIQFEGHCT